MTQQYRGDIGLLRQMLTKSGVKMGASGAFKSAWNDKYPVKGGFRRRLKVVVDSDYKTAKKAFKRIQAAFGDRFVRVCYFDDNVSDTFCGVGDYVVVTLTA